LPRIILQALTDDASDDIIVSTWLRKDVPPGMRSATCPRVLSYLRSAETKSRLTILRLCHAFARHGLLEQIWALIAKKDQPLENCEALVAVIPPDIARLLVQARSARLNVMIAHRKELPVDVMEKLARDPAKNVRRNLARNENLPDHITWQLAHDDEINVRMAVAERYNLPGEVKKFLKEDGHLEIQLRLERNEQSDRGGALASPVNIQGFMQDHFG
jgi:hypothetical protein